MQAAGDKQERTTLIFRISWGWRCMVCKRHGTWQSCWDLRHEPAGSCDGRHIAYMLAHLYGKKAKRNRKRLKLNRIGEYLRKEESILQALIIIWPIKPRSSSRMRFRLPLPQACCWRGIIKVRHELSLQKRSGVVLHLILMKIGRSVVLPHLARDMFWSQRQGRNQVHGLCWWKNTNRTKTLFVLL